jgi:sugar diacid utilization regulator
MDSFRCFLQDLNKSTGIRFALIIDSENKFNMDLDVEDSEAIIFNIELRHKEAKLYLLEEYKSNFVILKYVISKKYNELFDNREQAIIDILEGKDTDIDDAQKGLCFPTRGSSIFIVNVSGNKQEALEIIRQLYLEQNIISFIYGDDILIMGMFDEIEDHARSLRESIISDLYCKCYVGYGNLIHNINDIVRSYNEAKESLVLGRIFYSVDEIFSYNKLLFEKIVFNIDIEIKQELMNKFKSKFDNFDIEMINTIEEFVNSGLNISDAARKLYVHRNTLIYRLDKIKKETGFDIREFREVTVFIIAFLVWKEKSRI